MERRKRPAWSAFVFLTGFFMVLFACVCLFFLFRQSREKEAQARLKDIADQTVRNIQQRLDDTFVSLKDAGAVLLELPSIQDTQAADLLRVLARNHQAASLAVADLEGRATVSNGKSCDVSRQSYFLHAMKGGWVVSEVVTSSIDGEESIVFSIPLYDGNDIAGVLMCTYHLDQLRSRFALDDGQKEVFASIIQADGKMILPCENQSPYIYYSSVLSQADIRGDMTAQELYSRLKSDQSGSFQYRVEGKNYCVIYQPVQKNGWYLISTAQNSVLEGTGTTATGLTLCFAAAAMGLFLLAFCSVRRLTVRQCGVFTALDKSPLPVSGGSAGAAVLAPKRRGLPSRLKCVRVKRKEISQIDPQWRLLLEKTKSLSFCWDRGKDTISFFGTWLKKAQRSLKAQSFSQMFVTQTVCAADRPTCTALFEAAVRQRVPGEATVRLLSDCGRPVRCRICICSILEENGAPVQVGGVLFHLEEEKPPMLQAYPGGEALRPQYDKNVGIPRINDWLKQEGEHTLWLLRLDNLKSICRCLGPDADKVLFARLEQGFKGAFDIPYVCFAMGKDKFAAFFPHTAAGPAIEEKIQLQVSLLHGLFPEEEKPIKLQWRMGAATSPRDGVHFDELCSRADAAARRAQECGGESLYLYPSA